MLDVTKLVRQPKKAGCGSRACYCTGACFGLPQVKTVYSAKNIGTTKW